MKNFMLVWFYLFALTVEASIEFSPEDSVQPSEAELVSSRACFKELDNEGCGDPGEEPKHFRSCMSGVFARLTPECQKLMKELYGRK